MGRVEASTTIILGSTFSDAEEHLDCVIEASMAELEGFGTEKFGCDCVWGGGGEMGEDVVEGKLLQKPESRSPRLVRESLTLWLNPKCIGDR